MRTPETNADFQKDGRKGRLKRQRHVMPEFVRAALLARGLMDAYLARPPYQQNDYVGWITRAKRETTAQNRLGQMLDELHRGGVYMKMKHRPSRTDKSE